jgi:hypothetical protein
MTNFSITFTSNWNNKLYCNFFTTFRVFNRIIHVPGNQVIVIVPKNIPYLSDFDAKKRWLANIDISNKDYNKINFNDEYNIIDEFDSHHNYLQSIFNYVTNTEKCLTNMCEFKLIYDFVNHKIKEIPINENNMNKFLEFYYNQSEKMIYNINYGFDPENNYVICIPFSRKDTPIKGSNFSSLLLRLILTFKIYIQYPFFLYLMLDPSNTLFSSLDI